jgi:hypothetical protein
MLHVHTLFARVVWAAFQEEQMVASKQACLSSNHSGTCLNSRGWRANGEDGLSRVAAGVRKFRRRFAARYSSPAR